MIDQVNHTTFLLPLSLNPSHEAAVGLTQIAWRSDLQATSMDHAPRQPLTPLLHGRFAPWAARSRPFAVFS